jgi:hypothetical protein
MFGKTKIYAIKNSLVEKLSKEHKLVPFNQFFKDKLKIISAKRFDTVTCYNSLAEYCRKEFSDKEPNNRYWYNEGDVVNQFACHMLNIFGLDYKKFIKNTEMVSVIDNFLIMEYFSTTVHNHKYDIKLFKADAYHAHINEILKTIGIDSIDSENIRAVNVAYNQLVYQIQSRIYASDPTEYLELIKPVNKNKFNLPKKSELRKTIRAEVDKNPMVKYIMGTHRVDGQLRTLGTKNPIANLCREDYSRTSKDWFAEMTQDNLELFKIQLSSLIR